MPSLLRRTATRLIAACAVLATLMMTAPAHAGQSCEDRPPTVDALRRSLALAVNTADALDAAGAEVVVLARAGQDLSRYGLRWSHLGFAYKVPTTGPEGVDRPVWRVVHKLNTCGSDTGGLYRQGLGDFFSDDPFRYEAIAAPLRPEVAAQVLKVLREDKATLRLQHAPYSMVAYPWASRYQQSNQWAIETLAYAMAPQADRRDRAQAWLRLHGYAPTTLNIGHFERLGARMTRANIAFDDHPDELRFSNRIETVTADSVLTWLSRARLAGRAIIIR